MPYVILLLSIFILDGYPFFVIYIKRNKLFCEFLMWEAVNQKALLWVSYVKSCQSKSSFVRFLCEKLSIKKLFCEFLMLKAVNQKALLWDSYVRSCQSKSCLEENSNFQWGHTLFFFLDLEKKVTKKVLFKYSYSDYILTLITLTRLLQSSMIVLITHFAFRYLPTRHPHKWAFFFLCLFFLWWVARVLTC